MWLFIKYFSSSKLNLKSLIDLFNISKSDSISDSFSCSKNENICLLNSFISPSSCSIPASATDIIITVGSKAITLFEFTSFNLAIVEEPSLFLIEPQNVLPSLIAFKESFFPKFVMRYKLPDVLGFCSIIVFILLAVDTVIGLISDSLESDKLYILLLKDSFLTSESI